MRVLVFGAGAIGAFLGHRLASAGHEITLVGRPAFVRAVQDHGLILEQADHSLAPGGRARHESGDGHKALDYGATSSCGVDPDGLGRVVVPAAVESISGLAPAQRLWDLVLLTVKAYDTVEAAESLVPCLSHGVPVLIVQNGVGGEELAQQALPESAIISGVLTLSVSVVAPGHVRLETSRGGLNLAPTRADADVQAWAELFTAAGLRTATYRDYRAMKWSKLLLNIQANAIPAILDMPPGDVYAHPDLFRIERAAFLEALAVMRSLGLKVVSFPNYPVPLLAWAMQSLPTPLLRPVLTRLVASGRGEKKPSLQMDLAGGRQRSEALYLNGSVVSHAQHLGLRVPINQALRDTLLGIAEGRIPWEEFRGQPEKLLAVIER